MRQQRPLPASEGSLAEQSRTTQAFAEDEFIRAMKDDTCVICYEKAERLIATCCKAIICQICLQNQDARDAKNCAWCKKDMTLTQYVDLPNAFQVFKKVKQVFKDQSKEDEKLSSAARLRQFIQERIGHGQDPEEYPQESLLTLEEEDREWFTRLVRKAGGLYREDPDQGDGNPDAEEVMEVDTKMSF